MSKYQVLSKINSVHVCVCLSVYFDYYKIYYKKEEKNIFVASTRVKCKIEPKKATDFADAELKNLILEKINV